MRRKQSEKKNNILFTISQFVPVGNNSSFENMNNSHSSRRMDGSEVITRKHISDSQLASILDRRHLEDVTNHQQQQQQNSSNTSTSDNSRGNHNKALIIDDPLTKLDPVRAPFKIYRFIHLVRISDFVITISINNYFPAICRRDGT